MNIANIFGLHLGCMVRLENGKQFKVDGACYGKSSNRPMVRCNDEDLSLYIDHCKLLLKPLSAISEEDKAEFWDKFYPESHNFWRYMRVVGFNKEGLEVYSTREGGCPYSYIRKYLIEETLWLASKGYDVGIVPDEYKEIYHGK